MKSTLRSLVVFLISLAMVSCGLATMKEVPLQDSVVQDMALVSVVRPRVFLGDGVKTELWDGDEFVGTLSAGSMIQFLAEPGLHTFMVYSRGDWGLARGELKPGKRYYLKFNVGFGFFVLGVADADDPRIVEWNETLMPVAIDRKASRPVSSREVERARKILDSADRGEAKYTQIEDRHAI